MTDAPRRVVHPPRSPRKGVRVSADENTRLVQSAYEAFGQGDMAAFAEVMADDIEWVDPGDPDDDRIAGCPVQVCVGKGSLGGTSGAIRIRRLPRFSPRYSPAIEPGACSIPSRMSSR